MNEPTLCIETSHACKSEKQYIFDWVFGEIFGIEIEITWRSAPIKTRISHPATGQTTLTVRDEFFDIADANWLSQQSLPTRIELPWGRDPSMVNSPEPGSVEIDVDLFGILFFLISRYEEAVIATRDQHDRFPSIASVLSASNFLSRPIGNELIEQLWKALKSAWPSLDRRPREFRILPSHDIDHPAAFWKPPGATTRSVLGSIRQGRLSAGLAHWKNSRKYDAWCRAKTWNQDPNDTIDWIMERSEEHELTSAFFYIPQKTDARDLAMPLDHPHVVDQWYRISRRGHEIGIHPGYQTYLSAERIMQAATGIRTQLERLKISQPLIGSRQHFLRWKTPETAIALNDAGIDYDSSLGFADRSGFRCGVCYEFPMYDLVNRHPLKIRQRPLIIMESSVIDRPYMGLGNQEKAFELMVQLKRQCQIYQGDFTILWHNHRFRDEQEKRLYCDVLSA